MIMLTEAVIEQRLREAVSFGRVVTTASEAWVPSIRTSASPREHEHTIRDIAEAISWLRWLDDEDAALVQARLEGARWKMICWRFSISRPTAYRRWRHALGLIAWHLNGHALPAGCSRRRFMQLAARM